MRGEFPPPAAAGILECARPKPSDPGKTFAALIGQPFQSTKYFRRRPIKAVRVISLTTLETIDDAPLIITATVRGR